MESLFCLNFFGPIGISPVYGHGQTFEPNNFQDGPFVGEHPSLSLFYGNNWNVGNGNAFTRIFHCRKSSRNLLRIIRIRIYVNQDKIWGIDINRILDLRRQIAWWTTEMDAFTRLELKGKIGVMPVD